jgi:chorismate mutase/prephenate dehydrogenase
MSLSEIGPFPGLGYRKMSKNKPPLPPRLGELRKRLDDIDAGIVDLISERQQVVSELGELKLDTGAPLRHYEREREVIERGMERAKSQGVSGRVAREIMETLIHHSLGSQEENQWVRSEHGQGKGALVIGGAGRMGHWMARYLDTVGYSVDIADPSAKESPFSRIEDWQSKTGEYALIVVAVPLRPSNDVLLKLAEIGPDALLFDIGSLKSPMREGLNALRDAGCRVCSVHPMFGPEEIGLSGRHILFIDVGHDGAVAESRALFAHTAAECVDLSLDEHDEVMAWVLSLSHLVNIAFAAALAESGEAVPLLKQISSSTFNCQLKVAAQVVSENPHLYYEIQQGNDRTADVVGRFRDVLDRLCKAVAEEDEASFTRSMESAHRHIRDEQDSVL